MLAISHIDPPEFWRERAEEMVRRADAMSDPETKRIMLRLAVEYEALADRALRMILGAERQSTLH